MHIVTFLTFSVYLCELSHTELSVVRNKHGSHPTKHNTHNKPPRAQKK